MSEHSWGKSMLQNQNGHQLVKAVSLLATGSPSLKEVYADYLSYLPRYRDIPDLSGVACIRPFFGFVPNWHDTPLKPITSRLLHIGDSAGNRSALSFAGGSFSTLSRCPSVKTQAVSALHECICCLVYDLELSLHAAICRLWVNGKASAPSYRGVGICP